MDTITVVGVGLVWAACYAGSCWIFPFGKCWRCDGSGRIYRKKDRKVFRLCRRCKTTGRRLRVGRVVWNYVNRTQRKAAKWR